MVDDPLSPDPVAELIASATGAGTGSPGTEQAVDAVTTARNAETETAQPKPSEPALTAPVQGEPARKYTKAELQAEVERLRNELNGLKERNTRLESMTSEKAIDRLGATIALGIKLGGRFMAAKRGDHWLFDKKESDSLGEAWAEVAAPYADQIKEAVPWVLALALTWQSLSERLEKDGTLAPDPDKKDGGTA